MRAELVSRLGAFRTALTSTTGRHQAIAERKACPQQLRSRFNEVESQFDVNDRLIQHYRATPTGRDLIAAWQGWRVIRDLGHGPSSGADNEHQRSDS